MSHVCVEALVAILGLVKLDPTVADLVEEGKIPLANAQALAKIPVTSQVDYAPLAMTQQPQEFMPKMTEIARQMKEGGPQTTVPKEYHRFLLSNGPYLNRPAISYPKSRAPARPKMFVPSTASARAGRSWPRSPHTASANAITQSSCAPDGASYERRPERFIV